MGPEDIKQLRAELRCTARELAAALDIDHAMVRKWEHEELFPTRHYIDRMNGLRKQGPGSVPRLQRHDSGDLMPALVDPALVDPALVDPALVDPALVDPMRALADPELWRLIRKLAVHPELRQAVATLASDYDDPGS